jgi:hypothetical protein
MFTVVETSRAGTSTGVVRWRGVQYKRGRSASKFVCQRDCLDEQHLLLAHGLEEELELDWGAVLGHLLLPEWEEQPQGQAPLQGMWQP